MSEEAKKRLEVISSVFYNGYSEKKGQRMVANVVVALEITLESTHNVYLLRSISKFMIQNIIVILKSDNVIKVYIVVIGIEFYA